MAGSGGQDQSRSHLEGTVPEKQGFLSRVKDSLNLTKHLGFVSDLDSPASQAALAAAREEEEREGVTEVAPQAPLSERVMQGVNAVADTAAEITAGASGGVHPKGEVSPEQEEAFKADSLPDGTVRKESEHQQELSGGAVPHGSEDGKHVTSWAHMSGHKETDPKAEKEGHTFSKWALRAAHKLGDAVASKDLTDDQPSKNKANKK